MTVKKVGSIEIGVYTAINRLTQSEKDRVARFLHEQLGEYGDPLEHISKCLEYATSYFRHEGGVVIVARENQQMLGAVVVNRTGMESYIPENILVYIAVHQEHRGRGIGRALMEEALVFSKGDIALHVEPDNPARKLYEQMGFTNKYLEMRLIR